MMHLMILISIVLSRRLVMIARFNGLDHYRSSFIYLYLAL